MNFVKNALIVATVITAAGAAQAAPVLLFSAQLADHPDGSASPPPYGLRIDNLFKKNDAGANLPGGNARNGTTSFSFSAVVNNVAAAVFTNVWDDDMDGDADRIRIFGNAYGGRDTGAGYGVGAGWYNLDFTYDLGIVEVPSVTDGGWRVQDGASRDAGNRGTITALSGDYSGESWGFSDKADDSGFTFNFLKNGHRLTQAQQNTLGDPFVGEGWVQLDNGVSGTQDWLFVTTCIPMPTPAMLAGAGILGLIGCTRRRLA